MSPKKVLITGVYGLIGNVLYRRLARNPEAYEVYGLARRAQPSQRVQEGGFLEVPADRFHRADVADFGAVQKAVRGMEVVVHLAADPSGGGGWESVRDNNVVGTYQVFEASRIEKVKRIVFASSIQVSSGYGKEEPYRSIMAGNEEGIPPEIPVVRKEWPTRPLNIYACSKVWGEALAYCYAQTQGISGLCVRIGWVRDPDCPPDSGADSIWCSQEDIAQLLERCINAPESVVFDIFYGMSQSRRRWVDIEHAREVLGYDPQAWAEDSVAAGT